jgi:septal ring factor EnvC (AmiA/AmiB activator)
MGTAKTHTPRIRASLAALFAAALLGAGATQALGAQSIDELNSQIAGAKDQAQSLGAQIDQTTAELAATQQQAIVAAEREAQLNAVLVAGREREAQLEAQVAQTRDALAAARAQLQRGLGALSDRLVDIYRGGMPDETTLLLESDGWDDLQTRAEYLRRIEEADAGLVSRVRTLRDDVSKRLAAVEDAQQRAEDWRRFAPSARPRSRACRPRWASGPARSSGSSASPPSRHRARSPTGSATG